MPTVTVSFTEQEVFDVSVTAARKLSDEVLRLADVNKTPLAPGENADARRHKIASLGKKLAEAFVVIDDLMTRMTTAGQEQHASDVTADAPSVVDPNAN